MQEMVLKKRFYSIVVKFPVYELWEVGEGGIIIELPICREVGGAV